jgi:tyrosine-protein phosphatase SIW14
MLKQITIITLLLCVLSVGCERKQPAAKPKPKPNQFTYATRVELEGCSNLYKVSDALYRGAQPTKQGFKNLEELGIKTIVNLRTFHGDKDIIKGTSLKYKRITMQAWEGEMEEVVDFLKVVNDPNSHPVFVHCLHGADRTGTMTAIYRIVMQDWTKEKALEEMTKGDYNFHKTFKNLPKFIKNLDTEKLKKSLNEKSEK